MNNLEELLQSFTQTDEYGGSNTPPEIRLFLLSLALSMKAKSILELGFDRCYTTKALAMAGCHVVAVDNLNTQSAARNDLPDNVELIVTDAMEYLTNCQEKFDLVFVDDDHNPGHVARETKLLIPLVRPNGIVVYHDTSYYPNLRETVLAIFPNHEHVEIPAISQYRLLRGYNMGLLIVKFPGVT